MTPTAVLATALVAQPEPRPTLPANTVPEALVTPGWIGFVAMALVAIVVVLLVVDMTRRVRRTRYRGEIRERLAAEREAQEAQGATDADVTSGDGPAGTTPDAGRPTDDDAPPAPRR